MARQAFSAIATVSATTAATRCPRKRTVSSSTTVSSGSSWRFSWRAVENATSGLSRCVRTRCTPSIASAAVVSIATILACATGLVSTERCSRPAGAKSIVYCSVPVTTRIAAGAPMERPTPPDFSTLTLPSSASVIARYPVQRHRFPFSA